MVNAVEPTDLIRIAGVDVPILASAGTEEHARAIGARTALAHAWLSDLLGFRPRVEVAVLAPAAWSRITAFPVFGFPHFVGEGRLVVAGTPAPFFADLLQMIWPDLAEDGHDMLRAVYGDPPRLDAFGDLLAVHELAHLYHSQAGFWFPERWLSELFCNVALEGWVVEHALEAGPAGPTNYAWYQLMLHVTARTVWRRGGAGALQKLFDRFRDGAPGAELRTTLRLEVDPAFADVIDRWPAVAANAKRRG